MEVGETELSPNGRVLRKRGHVTIWKSKRIQLITICIDAALAMGGRQRSILWPTTAREGQAPDHTSAAAPLWPPSTLSNWAPHRERREREKKFPRRAGRAGAEEEQTCSRADRIIYETIRCGGERNIHITIGLYYRFHFTPCSVLYEYILPA